METSFMILSFFTSVFMNMFFSPDVKSVSTAKSVYEFELPDIDGKKISLASYKGKVLLVVNVASKCGYTPQYEALQRVYELYKSKGFIILGFPANNFLGQEPGTNEEIKTFCSSKYAVSFPMFSKISVKGGDIHPLYNFLTTSNEKWKGDVKWNFTKFLIAKDGTIIQRFESKEKPDSEAVIRAIEVALQQ